MKYVITVRKVHRWTGVFFIINWLIVHLVKYYYQPLECNDAKSANLTSHQVEKECFIQELRTSKYSSSHSISPFYSKYIKAEIFKSKKIFIYEEYYYRFNTLLMLLAVIFMLMGLTWLAKGKYKRNHLQFHAAHPLLRQIARDEERDLEDDPNGDKRLLLWFKRSVRRKDVQIIFGWSVSHAVSAFFTVVLTSYFTNDFLKRFVKDVHGDASDFENTFPEAGNCGIKYLNENYKNDGRNFESAYKYEEVDCKLVLNRFYEINQKLIWYCLLILFVTVLISAFQLFALANFEEIRLDRLAKLAPNIDKNSLEPFAYDTKSYFVLEERYSKLDKDQFQRLIKLLIEEEYRLDLVLRNVIYV